MSLLENFEGYIKTRSYAERISISSSGGISFNTTVFERLQLNKYQQASFFYNKNNGYVGILFSNTETPDSYHLSPRKNADGKLALYLSIKGFVMSYKIVPTGIKKYEIENFEYNGDNLEVVLKPIEREVDNREGTEIVE